MIRITVKVVPQSGKQLMQWDQKQQILKCYLKSAPEKNKANDELIALFSQKLGIPKSFLTIIGGMTSRRKTVAIESSLLMADIYRLLGIGDEVGIRQQTIG